ncbi:MAG: hypothetical protein V1806_17400, partial [Pseudomonadota bacterium]
QARTFNGPSGAHEMRQVLFVPISVGEVLKTMARFSRVLGVGDGQGLEADRERRRSFERQLRAHYQRKQKRRR